MNKYLTIAAVVLLVALGISCYQTESITDKWKTAEANVKAYSQKLSASDNKNTALQLTCSQLGYFNDSVLKALDETRKELKIKDKNLKALQAVKSKFSKKDTIRITQTDTLFREPTLNLDTLIGDKWYSLRLGLKYPSMIAVEPEFKSEKHIIVSTKKETVDPPKKFFLFRWFQRKHTVLHVDIDEKNPYVKDSKSEYAEIIK
jgi:hypothetical protein